MGQNRENEQLDAIGELVDRGIIENVLGTVKSGKEATVYCCQAMNGGLVAAKVYRSRNVRGFRDDSAYREGRMRGVKRREVVAITKRTKVGREMAFEGWVGAEFETLRLLHAAGCDVPRPIVQDGSVILMEFLGTEDEPAPPLASVRLERAEAERIFDVLMRNVELMLARDRIHGDLSPYNVLYRDGDVRIIDFPQAVDPRFNSNALSLLERDIDNLCRYFARHGVDADGWRISRDLWSRFLRSEIHA